MDRDKVIGRILRPAAIARGSASNDIYIYTSFALIRPRASDTPLSRLSWLRCSYIYVKSVYLYNSKLGNLSREILSFIAQISMWSFTHTVDILFSEINVVSRCDWFSYYTKIRVPCVSRSLSLAERCIIRAQSHRRISEFVREILMMSRKVKFAVAIHIRPRRFIPCFVARWNYKSQTLECLLFKLQLRARRVIESDRYGYSYIPIVARSPQ